MRATPPQIYTYVLILMQIVNKHTCTYLDVYLNKFPTLQFLILNISAVTSAITRIFRVWVSEVMK